MEDEGDPPSKSSRVPPTEVWNWKGTWWHFVTRISKPASETIINNKRSFLRHLEPSVRNQQNIVRHVARQGRCSLMTFLSIIINDSIGQVVPIFLSQRFNNSDFTYSNHYYNMFIACR